MPNFKCNADSLLSRSSLEPLISLDLASMKLYCFRARAHCYHCLYVIFSSNPVRHSKELPGSPRFLNPDSKALTKRPPYFPSAL